MFAVRAAAIGLLLCAGAWAQKPGEPITLNFVGAEIEAVARTMGVITGRTVVVDPRVRGTINLSSEKPQSPAAAYAQFVAALRLQGYTVVESSGIYKVVPEAEGKLQGSVVTVAPDSRLATRSSPRSSGSTTRAHSTWCRCCAR